MTTAMFVLAILVLACAVMFCVAAWVVDSEDLGLVAAISGVSIALGLSVLAIVQFGMA